MNTTKNAECQNDCQTCEALCHPKCPKCGATSIEVPSITVINLTSQKIDLNKTFYLCTKPKCDVVYFDSENEQIITKQDVKVKVWYKSSYQEYVVCYCENIMLDDIVKAVHALNGEKDETKILQYLNKKRENKKCIINNPTGKSCDKLLTNAINYAYDIYMKGGHKC